MRTFSFETCLPPVGCSPNERRHWRVQSKARKAFKNDVMKSLLVAGLPPTFHRCTVRVTFYCGRLRVNGRVVKDKCYRPRDKDNAAAACKGLFDAMSEMKVWPDDSAKYMSPYFEIVGEAASKGRAGVLVEVVGE